MLGPNDLKPENFEKIVKSDPRWRGEPTSSKLKKGSKILNGIKELKKKLK